MSFWEGGKSIPPYVEICVKDGYHPVSKTFGKLETFFKVQAFVGKIETFKLFTNVI
jgi:hypothetical protein